MKNLHLKFLLRLFICLILSHCFSLSYAETDRELDEWGTGHRSSNNTYIFKKSNDNFVKISPEFSNLLELEIPSLNSDVNELMSSQNTRIILLSVNKKIIFEKYLKNSLRNSTPLAFSMSKSLTSIAIGKAYCSEKINSLNDSVSKYVPRLNNTSWGNSTIQQLLLMNSGSSMQNMELAGWQNEHVKFKNSYIYSGNQYRDYIDDMTLYDEKKFKQGEIFQYNNYDTIALGLVIEGAVGKGFSEYFDESIWAFIGAEKDGAWLRNRKSQTATYNGFSASPEDYIRLGHHINKLFTQDNCVGNYLRESIKFEKKVTTTRCYGYQIWSWCDGKSGFFFVGYGGQYLVMQPSRDVVLYLHQGSDKNIPKLIAIYSKILNHLYKSNFTISGISLND
jgi:CubicO group peptidase (beta-lactamase class C family)